MSMLDRLTDLRTRADELRTLLEKMTARPFGLVKMWKAEKRP